jgi:hypothetical protein
MNINTFGNFKSAQDLAQILEKDKRNRRKVAGLLTDYSTLNYQIYLLARDLKFREELYRLLKEDFIRRIDNSNWTDEIKTFTKAVIITRYRERSLCTNIWFTGYYFKWQEVCNAFRNTKDKSNINEFAQRLSEIVNNERSKSV